jgi:hypothetical protein
MLSKEPDERPADGRAVVDALRALGDVEVDNGTSAQRVTGRRTTALRGGEQRGIALILIAPHPEQIAQQEANGRDATFIAVAEDQALVKEAARHGGRAERMLDGSVSVLMVGNALATDLAAQAARCALALRPHGHERRIALAMGRTHTLAAGRGSLGQTIEAVAKTPADVGWVSINFNVNPADHIQREVMIAKRLDEVLYPKS